MEKVNIFIEKYVSKILKSIVKKIKLFSLYLLIC